MRTQQKHEPYTAPVWSRDEAERFMDQNNRQYASAVAERRIERDKAEKELYYSIRKQD